MPRPKSLTAAAINIAIQPPIPATYVSFWKDLFDLRIPVKIRGDQMLMIGSIETVDDQDPLSSYRGLLYRFTQIDLSKPWFDLIKGKEADGGEVKREVKIPAHLCPNLATFAYYFNPSAHRLIFEANSTDSGSISPSTVEKLITTLAGSKEIATKYPNCEITMEQDRDGIEEILANRFLLRLVVSVKKPNPDGPDPELEKLIFKEMEREGLQEKMLALKAPKGGTIRPSYETQRYAEVAASNGSVQAIVSDGQSPRRLVSSRAKPRQEITTYDQGQTTLRDHFENIARSLMAKLVGGKRIEAEPAAPDEGHPPAAN